MPTRIGAARPALATDAAGCTSGTAVRVPGTVADRTLDNWIVDVVIGNWFDRPIERYLEPSNRPVAGPRPGISLRPREGDRAGKGGEASGDGPPVRLLDPPATQAAAPHDPWPGDTAALALLGAPGAGGAPRASRNGLRR